MKVVSKNQKAIFNHLSYQKTILYLGVRHKDINAAIKALVIS
jgi:hypothetical protein